MFYGESFTPLSGYLIRSEPTHKPVAATGNCADNLLGLSVLYPLSMSASTLLLLCRLRLVYDDNLRVAGPFSVLWLCVLGEAITVPFGVEASAIGPTDYCIVSELRKFTLAAAMAPMVYDTAVYIAVMCRLAATQGRAVPARERVGELLTGSHLPGVSKSIFKDSRLYYVYVLFSATPLTSLAEIETGSVALSSNALTAIMILASSISVPLRSAFFALNITLVNVMACRAYRNMKLGVLQKSNFTTSDLTPPPTVPPRAGSSSSTLHVRFRHTNTDATGSYNFRARDNYTQQTYPKRPHNTFSGYKGDRGCSRSRVAVNVIPASPSSMTTSFGGEESTMDYWNGGDAQSMISSHSGSGIPVYLPSEDSHRSAGKASSFLVI